MEGVFKRKKIMNLGLVGKNRRRRSQQLVIKAFKKLATLSLLWLFTEPIIIYIGSILPPLSKLLSNFNHRINKHLLDWASP